MQPHASPLPVRDGIAPSYLWLPQGHWPDLLTFLLHKFSHLDPDILRQRLAQGDIVDETGQALQANSPYRPGSCIHYYRVVPDEPAIPFDEKILFRDERLLAVDKPHFLATIPGGRHLRETLVVRLRAKLGLPELTPIHRLDRETAGVVLFCLHPPSRGAYQRLFEQRSVSKVYEALAPYRDDLTLPRVHRSRLAEAEDFFLMREVEGEPNSETRIDLIERHGNDALYRLEPHTGKKHQLRAHMAALGIPIRNDRWYPQLQEDKADDYSRPLKLLARAIEFTDPISGAPRRFESQRSL